MRAVWSKTLTVAGAAATTLSACALSTLVSHTNTSEIRVAYPPDFSCHPIASDFGAYTNPDGSQRTFSAPHRAIDVLGEVVIAPASGKVIDIAYHSKAGYILTLLHSPKDVSREGMYLFTYFSHLGELGGRNSAMRYVRVGDTVVAGQPIAEVGKTGQNVAYQGSIEHLHFEIWTNSDGVWSFSWGDRDNREDRLVYVHRGSSVNPHDVWARHPLDRVGQVKYIPPFEEGSKPEGGLVYPVRCQKGK